MNHSEALLSQEMDARPKNHVDHTLCQGLKGDCDIYPNSVLEKGNPFSRRLEGATLSANHIVNFVDCEGTLHQSYAVGLRVYTDPQWRVAGVLHATQEMFVFRPYPYQYNVWVDVLGAVLESQQREEAEEDFLKKRKR